jgi:hypothetical protein
LPNCQADEYLNKFVNLVKSVNEKGFSVSSKLECDCQNKLIDGSHRLAVNIYNQITKNKLVDHYALQMITLKCLPIKRKVDYSIDFFYENEFDIK